MVRNKKAEPVSVEVYDHGSYNQVLDMNVWEVKLDVTGDCVSKSYEGNLVKSLNPPIAMCGVFKSVIYCPETNITTIKYWFEPYNCILKPKTHARLFAKRMQRRINRLKLKNMKEVHENTK